MAEKENYELTVSFGNRSKCSKDVFRKLGINLKEGKPLKSTINLSGYFEDYNLYIDHIDKIKTWFPKIENRNNNDLVFHLRLGDRLFYKETHSPNFKIKPSQYLNAINQFDFDKLHIVTDMKDWKRLSKNDLMGMEFHRGGCGGQNIIGTDIGIKDISVAVDYFNSIYDTLCDFNPTVRYGSNVADDFSYIRSFDKILFQHGTMSWWASMLSDASQVKVYKHWRPQKGKNNKNLSQVPLLNWEHWE